MRLILVKQAAALVRSQNHARLAESCGATYIKYQVAPPNPTVPTKQ